MKHPSLPFRLASVFTLLFAMGHTLGGLKGWSPIGQTDVLTAMQTFRFDAGGVNRSYFEFYRGFGFLLSVFLVTQAVLLWQLGNLARRNSAQARPLAWTFFLASLPIDVLTGMFLFPTPVYFDVVLTALLGWAALSVSRSSN